MKKAVVVVVQIILAWVAVSAVMYFLIALTVGDIAWIRVIDRPFAMLALTFIVAIAWWLDMRCNHE